jgi:transcriptional regulator with GAF, ATPase, and Fis domain
MSQISIAHDVIRRRVPRRTWIFLLISNNFHFIITVPILAVILFLNTNPLLSVMLGAFAILSISAFWTAYNLDPSLQNDDHPHHKSWNRFKSSLLRIAPFLQRRPAWQISFVGWVLASVPIFFMILPLVSSSDLTIVIGSRLGFDLYWLSYIPVLAWISYRANKYVSEWFGFFWFLSALGYSICFFIYYKDPVVDKGLHLIILMGWFFFLSLIIHYLFRRIAIFRGQAELVQDVTETLRNDRRYTEAFDARPIQNEPDEALNEIAKYIGTMLLYDRVFILVADQEQEKLYMKGRYGVEAPWPDEGWSINNQNSITGWVARNKEEHLCAVTHDCDLFFNPNDAYPCKSEATVPILVGDECVGVLDIESAHPKAFNQSDIRLLWQIANSIGAALGYERHVKKEVDKTHKLLGEASEILTQSKNLDEALQTVAQKLREIFKVDLVVMYKHAVATHVPLPGLIIDGDVLFPKMLGHSIRNDSCVNELIRKPGISYVSPRADEDPFLLGPDSGEYNPEDKVAFGVSHRFVKREKIKSMIFLKLGTGDDIVGTIFLNYRRRMSFPSRMIESLYAIANVLTMGLVLKRKVERMGGPLAGATPLAHSTAEAAFESVSRDFDEMDWGQIERNPKTDLLFTQISSYREKLDELRREWTNLILVEHMNLQLSSMMESIYHLESKLHFMFPNVVFEWDSHEFIDIPTNDLGEVIYKIIAEGVSNALVHAHATHIRVDCKLIDGHLRIQVENDGQPIDPELAQAINSLANSPFKASETEKQTGIISILLDARRWFGAKWHLSGMDFKTTLLSVVLPFNTVMQKEYLDENKIEFE